MLAAVARFSDSAAPYIGTATSRSAKAKVSASKPQGLITEHPRCWFFQNLRLKIRNQGALSGSSKIYSPADLSAETASARVSLDCKWQVK
jgi:hypothetical protein